MSQVPAKISTMPAQRSCPNATSPAARKVSASPTTVTWFGVRGVRPSAVIKASACLRTQASNRVVNTTHLHCLGRVGGERAAGVLVNLDDLGGNEVPRVATCLLQRVVGKPAAQVGITRGDDERGGKFAPVGRLPGHAVLAGLEDRHVARHLSRDDGQA